MKKYTVLQAGLLAIITLVLGFLIGLFFQNPKTDNKDLTGAIRKVDRYRNVQITEDDILLRNELVEDTVKRAQYESYLLYYYYQSLKTSSDVEQVLNNTTNAEDFNKTYQPYINALKSFKVYLEPARIDILNALNLILLLDENDKVPVITYLNFAHNAIARIKNHNSILLNYMDALASYLENNADEAQAELEDAHDILALNVIQSAILTQNKPILSYLENKKMMNNKEGIKELSSDSHLKTGFTGQFVLDFETIGIEFPIICDMEELQLTVGRDIEKLKNFSESMSAYFGLNSEMNCIFDLGSQEALQNQLNDADSKLGTFMSTELLSVEYNRLM